jgi:hypothetical protein
LGAEASLTMLNHSKIPQGFAIGGNYYSMGTSRAEPRPVGILQPKPAPAKVKTGV